MSALSTRAPEPSSPLEVMKAAVDYVSDVSGSVGYSGVF